MPLALLINSLRCDTAAICMLKMLLDPKKQNQLAEQWTDCCCTCVAVGDCLLPSLCERGQFPPGTDLVLYEVWFVYCVYFAQT